MDDEWQVYWDIVKTALPEKTITGWVLIAEVHDSDRPRLHLATSELMTPWNAEGMLQRGLEKIAQIEQEYADVDEEEEE
jgi:hypothetical protein